MIVGSLEHAGRYESLHPHFAKAFAFLRSMDFNKTELGRVDLEGVDLYALVQAYETKEAADKKWETHQEYIDIQFAFAGTEVLGWAPAGALLPDGEYNPDKDVRLYRDGESFTPVLLQPGYFAILFPEDIHKPGCSAGKVARVIKVVVKVRIQAR